ncbi:DUF4019 domain-containing protein [Pseudoalteromonas sp. NEC-BIFX-2020_002]|uniref:DUF4019 domain-containing protein n=1 Tax=Pseudoalteromonas sp. NEC-BIFX-2020_002 TaxID=2732353 RepID=UPI0014776938|nr:DUF4019 domain-containing protein [Pseudoalteromonas sp. NEC-BIFX-2020_002]NNG41913.1 DUF4019 domain-containing protein [Pseudoalteromonas sp. NEC-BIFX-2020_002]
MKVIFAILCLLTTPFALAKTTEIVDVSKEISAATSWLEIVDSANYAKSWHQADPYFQANVTTQLWVSKLTEVRRSLGAVKSREGVNRQTFTSLPELPSGEYVMLQFQTDFENRKESLESITMKKSAEQWQVIGYFIQ